MNSGKCLSTTCTNDLCGLVRVTMQAVDLGAKCLARETRQRGTNEIEATRSRCLARSLRATRLGHVAKRNPRQRHL